jgi:hypothetical protein
MNQSNTRRLGDCAQTTASRRRPAAGFSDLAQFLLATLQKILLSVDAIAEWVSRQVIASRPTT